MKLTKMILLRGLFIIPFLTLSKIGLGQNYRTQQNQVFAYNILSNGLMGGFGGLINKPVNEKWYKAFITNFGKGCLGGLVKYSAKSQIWYLGNQNNNFLILPNRLFFFAGHSMVMNASKHKGLLDTYYLNYLGMDIRWNIRKEENIKPLQVRLSVQTLGSYFYMKNDNSKLDFYRSLECGQLYFVPDTNFMNSINADGYAGFNTIAIRDRPYNFLKYRNPLPHELIHTYQGYDFFPLTSLYYDRFLEKKIMNIKWCKKLSKYIVLDTDDFYFITAFLLQPEPQYYRNFFEFEAEHFASRNYIKR